MIKDAYMTRIVSGGKQFGFAVTLDNETVYIPGSVINEHNLTSDDEGTRNKFVVKPDDRGRSDFVAVTLCTDDSAMVEANNHMREEIERLCAVLDAAGVSY